MIELFGCIPVSTTDDEVKQKVDTALANWRDREIRDHSQPSRMVLASPSATFNLIAIGPMGHPLMEPNPDYVEDYTVPKSLGFDLGEVEVTKDGRILRRLEMSSSAHTLLRAVKGAFDPADGDNDAAEALAWHEDGDFPSLELAQALSEEEGNQIWGAMKGADEEGVRFRSQESVEIEELVILKGEPDQWKEVARVPLA